MIIKDCSKELVWKEFVIPANAFLCLSGHPYMKYEYLLYSQLVFGRRLVISKKDNCFFITPVLGTVLLDDLINSKTNDDKFSSIEEAKECGQNYIENWIVKKIKEKNNQKTELVREWKAIDALVSCYVEEN